MSISVAQAQIFFLALTRVLAIIVHVPVLAGRLVPNPVKIGLGILLTIVIIPWQPLAPEVEFLSIFPFGIAIGRELIIGTLAGFAAALTFGTLQVAGETMGIGSGFSSGKIMNPAFGDGGSPINTFFVMAATLLFLAIDGHHLFLQGLQGTFDVVPLNSPFPTLQVDRLIYLTARLITIGVHLALPVLGTVLLTDVVLGLLARVAPQIQVFFLGLPVKLGLSLIALALSLTMLFPLIADLFRAIGPRMLKLIGP